MNFYYHLVIMTLRILVISVNAPGWTTSHVESFTLSRPRLNKCPSFTVNILISSGNIPSIVVFMFCSLIKLEKMFSNAQHGWIISQLKGIQYISCNRHAQYGRFSMNFFRIWRHNIETSEDKTLKLLSVYVLDHTWTSVWYTYTV